MPAEWREGIGELVIDAKRIEVKRVGPAPQEAATILLLHEGLGCVALWRDVPNQLAARTGLGVFAYSRLGYGHSDEASLPRPLDYMEREAQEFLPEIIESAGITRGILFGHSDGASIAAGHAGLVRDKRIQAVILMAPHFFTEPSGLQSIAEAHTAYQQTDLKAKLGKYHRNPDNAFTGWNDAWLHPEFVSWNIEHVIAPIEVPILAIQGADDQYGTQKQIDVIAEKASSPVETVIIPDCRHSPHLEQPEATFEAIDRFLTRYGFIS